MKIRLLGMATIGLFFVLACLSTNAAEKPKITEAVRMDGANAINVNTTAKSDRSYWIGCSLRYKDGKMEDLEVKKARGSQTVMFFMKRISYKKFIIKLWEKKIPCSKSEQVRGHPCSKQEKKMGYFMQGEIGSTGWQTAGYKW